MTPKTLFIHFKKSTTLVCLLIISITILNTIKSNISYSNNTLCILKSSSICHITSLQHFTIPLWRACHEHLSRISNFIFSCSIFLNFKLISFFMFSIHIIFKSGYFVHLILNVIVTETVSIFFHESSFSSWVANGALFVETAQEVSFVDFILSNYDSI